MISLFKDERLSITIDNFLDVTFNLNTGKYFLFTKRNNTSLSIYSKSNYTTSIIYQLPLMTNKIISKLSYGDTDFNKAKITYKMPLKKSGYQTTLKFKEPFQNTTWNRNKVIWFNPPFSLNVMINIGKEFFQLIPKHFRRNHSFRKILNPNLIKISYSSMDKYDKSY